MSSNLEATNGFASPTLCLGPGAKDHHRGKVFSEDHSPATGWGFIRSFFEGTTILNSRKGGALEHATKM